MLDWQVDPDSKVSSLITDTCIFKIFAKQNCVKIDLNGVLIKDMDMTFAQLKV